MIGVKHSAETAGFICMYTSKAVGERPDRDEGAGVTRTGAFRSENVGTSNHNAGENPARRKTKVSLAMLISQGLVGPKVMANAGADGHRVDRKSTRLNSSHSSIS